MSRQWSSRLAAVALVGLIALALAPTASAKKGPEKLKDPTPVIFVHGGSGSGAQFESQQMRLTSNGFPQSRISVLEYDTLASLDDTIDEVHANLDAVIERAKAKSGKSQVDVLGHSRGTTVMHEYLASPERAANVRRYVNIDGRTADAPPGGVDTLAIWAAVRTLGPGDDDTVRQITGATNVTIPNQTHVQVATSKQSFREIFRFLIGKKPNTSNIEPGGKKVKIAGRAVVFPQNAALDGNPELEIWKVNKDGERKGKQPVAEPSLKGDGSFWGPVKVQRGKRYEFAILRNDGSSHHLYQEPFVRNDLLVRLLSSNPGEGVEGLLDFSPNSTGAVISRYKEFWGDAGAQSDVLTVEGVNASSAAISPVSNTTNGIFVEDSDSDGVSNTAAPIPTLFALPFLTGIDLFIPAMPPEDTVDVSLKSRGKGPKRTLNFPNFPSATDRVSLHFQDFEQKSEKGKKKGKGKKS